MAWKDIYNPGSSSFIAKVPSNSIYYNKPKMLIDLYQACRNDKPVGELKFGNGWLNYKNTGTHETLEVYLYLLDRVFKGFNNSSFSLHFDYNKRTKMYDYYLVPSMGCQAATNYVKEHIKCPKSNEQHVYASEVGEDLFGYIKGIILDVQKAIYEYVMIYENGNLEFEIEYAEDIEKIKELAISLGYTFYFGDHDTCGKEIAILDDKSLSGYDNKIEFVSSPYGLMKTEGDFKYVASIMGYKANSGEAEFKFKSPNDMFSFIKDMLIQYHDVKTKLLSVRHQLEEHLLTTV
jgi:hypothetical protein